MKSGKNTIDGKIDGLAVMVQRGFSSVEKRIDNVETGLEHVKNELEQIKYELRTLREEVEQTSSVVELFLKKDLLGRLDRLEAAVYKK